MFEIIHHKGFNALCDKRESQVQSVQDVIRKGQNGTPVDTKPAGGALIWDIPGTRTVRNTFPLFKNFPISGILLQRHKADEDNPQFGSHIKKLTAYLQFKKYASE